MLALSLVGLWCILSMHTNAATIEQLASSPVIDHIEISPGGGTLAVRTFLEDKHVLHFLDAETLEPVGGFTLRGQREVGDYHWINEERVVGEVWEAPLTQERPTYYGELFATNADGTKGELLFGYRSGERQTGFHIPRKDSDRAWARIIDVLPEDDRQVLISSTKWSNSDAGIPRAMMLDVYTGRERSVHVPSPGKEGSFFTDDQGQIRLITGTTGDGSTRVQALTADGEWVEIDESGHGDHFTPFALADGNEFVYVLDNPASDRIGLHRLALDGTSYERIFEHERVDVTDALISTDGRSVYALRVDDGFPTYLVLSGSHEEGKLFKQLLATFPGSVVSILSQSRDGRYWIIKTEKDVDAGSFYLLDSASNEVRKLSSSRPDVSPEELSPMQPVEFSSFDHQVVHGYFTPALSDGPEPAPMVVLVHDGLTRRDYWGYRSEVQVLATRGLSVLQINYRGSRGYGRGFEALGDRQWGDEVQKDIIAGTRWAISQGMAESGSVCIMGSRFGAYSALQSAILAPELFACVVATGGVYDLHMFYRDRGRRPFFMAPSDLEKKIGDDEDELNLYSPVHRIEHLQAPVFVAHSRHDELVPSDHARNLVRALDEHEKPYRWFDEVSEARRFYSDRNRIELLRAATDFIREHLAAAD